MALRANRKVPTERIAGYEFWEVVGDNGTVYNDFGACVLCGAIVDVGGEMCDHINQHNAERWDHD